MVRLDKQIWQMSYNTMRFLYFALAFYSNTNKTQIVNLGSYLQYIKTFSQNVIIISVIKEL